jgi:Tol biopolymer transport system component
VAFASQATNLIAGDNNGESDIFVRDRQLGTTTRVSVSSSGEEANRGSDRGYISSEGDDVVFSSWASNLVTNDTNGVADIFVYHRGGTFQGTTRVSVNMSGIQPEWHCYEPKVSAGGKFVVFSTGSKNLVDNDTSPPGVDNIFLSMPSMTVKPYFLLLLE